MGGWIFAVNVRKNIASSLAKNNVWNWCFTDASFLCGKMNEWIAHCLKPSSFKMFNENEGTTYGKCGLKSGLKKQKPGMPTEGQTGYGGAWCCVTYRRE